MRPSSPNRWRSLREAAEDLAETVRRLGFEIKAREGLQEVVNISASSAVDRCDELHRRHESGNCLACGQTYPCDTRWLIDEFVARINPRPELFDERGDSGEFVVVWEDKSGSSTEQPLWRPGGCKGHSYGDVAAGCSPKTCGDWEGNPEPDAVDPNSSVFLTEDAAKGYARLVLRTYLDGDTEPLTDVVFVGRVVDVTAVRLRIEFDEVERT